MSFQIICAHFKKRITKIFLAVNEDDQTKIKGYDTALLSKTEYILKGRSSDVSIKIPSGTDGILRRKVHTQFPYLCKLTQNDDEYIVAPAVEVHLKKSTTKWTEHLFTMKIPHCLQSDEERKHVNVRFVDKQRKHHDVPAKKENEDKKDSPYFEVDASHIIIYSRHFCNVYAFIKNCFHTVSYFLLFPRLTFKNIAETKGVTVEVFLCSEHYKDKDFKKVSYQPF